MLVHDWEHTKSNDGLPTAELQGLETLEVIERDVIDFYEQDIAACTCLPKLRLSAGRRSRQQP